MILEIPCVGVMDRFIPGDDNDVQSNDGRLMSRDHMIGQRPEKVMFGIASGII